MKAHNLTAGMSTDLPIGDVTQPDDFAPGERKPWTTPTVITASMTSETTAYALNPGTDTSTPVYGPAGS